MTNSKLFFEHDLGISRGDSKLETQWKSSDKH